MNKRELVTPSTTWLSSQRTIAKRLVNLYTAGSTSTLEVILGAQSLDEIINRIDTAEPGLLGRRAGRDAGGARSRAPC